MKEINVFWVFLLYVSVMFIITFLQQEYVLLPELQSLDIVGDNAKAQLLERYQKIRWLPFLLVPILLLLRFLFVALCLFVGGFFWVEMGGNKFREWWRIAVLSQSVLLLYSVILCTINVCCGQNTANVFTSYTSLLFLGGNNAEQWVRLPLSALNLFEVIYWIVMSLLINKLCGTRIKQSLPFVLSSYGVGYFLYIALLMFLLLYLT